MLMRSEVWNVGRNTVVCSEGWSLSLLDEQTMEYAIGPASCVLNVDYLPAEHSHCIHASESASPLFPRLAEHIARAAHLLRGRRYVID